MGHESWEFCSMTGFLIGFLGKGLGYSVLFVFILTLLVPCPYFVDQFGGELL